MAGGQKSKKKFCSFLALGPKNLKDKKSKKFILWNFHGSFCHGKNGQNMSLRGEI